MDPPAHPPWLAPLISVTTQLGVPTVFAGVLLWFVLFKVGGALETIEQHEIERTKLLTTMQETFVKSVQDQAVLTNKLLEKLEYCRGKQP